MDNIDGSVIPLKKSRRQDLTGKRFGKLTALEYDSSMRKWKCLCDCGQYCYKPAGQLNSGLAKSCGCSWHPSKVQKDMRFGRLTALRPTNQRSARAVVWECLCDCGNTTFVRSTLLASGHSTSCGCLKQDLDKTKDFKNILTYTDGTCIEFARNIANRRANTSSDTGVRGVILKDGKYQAHIQFQKKRHYLGRYSRLEDAIAVRKKAEARVEEYIAAYLSGDIPPAVSFDFSAEEAEERRNETP